MTIEIGDRLPSGTFKRFVGDRMADVSSEEIFSGRKVVLFSLPGAYTPTCSKVHLPGFVQKSKELRDKGVDEVICLSVNDPYVMRAWGKVHHADGEVTLLPDWDGSFTRALGLVLDRRRTGLGERGQRFSMIVEDGVVKSLDIEEEAGSVTVSGANECLAKL